MERKEDYVIKRDGTKEPVSVDKITRRIKQQCEGFTNVTDLSNTSVDGLKITPTSRPLDRTVNPFTVVQKVVAGIFDGVHTTALDTLAAETAAFMSTIHPDYETLAARIAISNLHKETKPSFLEVAKQLFHYVNPKNNKLSPLLSETVYNIIVENAEYLESQIDYSRDFDYSYFGFKTLCKSYLLRVNGHIAERPQHMLMRVALGFHKHNIKAAVETYHLMSKMMMTHATPTLFNSG